MLRTAVGFLGLLILLSVLQAGDSPNKSTPSQQYQALVKEYETAEKEFRNASAKTKTTQTQKKTMQGKDPTDKFARRFLELAEKNAKDPAALDALTWIVTHGGAVNKSDIRSPQSQARKILLRNHVQSERMERLCQTLGSSLDEDSQQLLHAVLEKSKHRPSQAQACLALAQQAEGRLSLAQQFKDEPVSVRRYQPILGTKAVAALVKAGPDKIKKEAEEFYQQAIEYFADVKDSDGGKVGEIAKSKLDALRLPIAVGNPAPDIVGEDIDGKQFKLSDYRGKVILLDFWGNW
jgi:hypothetical protein